jgi:septum formation protein
MTLSSPFILASRSPRRLALLSQIGLTVRVVVSDVPEDLDPALNPEANAESLARLKALHVARDIPEGIVLGADTIVVIDHHILGKPENEADAVRMLQLLSGRTHTVYTGFALVDRPSDRIVSGVEETKVTFRELPLDEITSYIRGGSPMDKAGSYGIQDDYGAVFVTRIEGCYYNVVGLPLARVHEAIKKIRVQSAERREDSNS